MYFAERKAYNKGEYILKFKNVRDFWIDPADGDIEVLNWGKIIENNEKNDIYIYNVSKIYEPEPDRILIHYIEPKFTEIPEWIFSKKVTSKVMSKFSIDRISLSSGSEITNIPEGLFKHNVNATDFGGIFQECTGLTSIPEGLFKNNLNVTNFESTFSRSTIINIPGGLFENNINVTNFSSTFLQCTGLMSIPETIIEYGKKVKEKGGDTYAMFRWCESASNYASIPNYMK